MPEDSRHFMKCQAGTMAVAEIRLKLSQCSNCLGLAWNAQATTDTFCNHYGRYAGFRIFCISIETTAYLRLQHLPPAAWGGGED